MDAIAGRFTRPEPRRHARDPVLGLMSDLPRKNCWTIAEHTGHTTPDALQHLLARASWDADAVRDDIRDQVARRLGAEAAVLVVDETGDLKKGDTTAGAARQYTGTAGRVENAQVSVFPAYSTTAGHALIDRELYLPACWTGDPARRRAAGIGDGTAFETKPALACRMIARALDAGAGADWVSGDEVYGASPHLREELEERGVGYVPAVACDHRFTTPAGRLRADEAARRVPRRAWQRLSAGEGAKGQRYYDWALAEADEAGPGRRCLLVRRHLRTGELAFYRCFSPGPVAPGVLVAVAGRRWVVEECFQQAKGLAGLDEHQVGRYTSWYRWTTLSMLAYAVLALAAAAGRAARPDPAGLIALTCREVQHLFMPALLPRLRGRGFKQAWSHWRRRHQARARRCHYQRQRAALP